MNADTQELIRCLKRDMRGDLKAAEHYAYRIACCMEATNPAMAKQYREAARLISEELRAPERN